MSAITKPPLLTLGPFIGVQTKPQGPYVDPGNAQSAVNANPNRYKQSLTAERGRLQLANLSLGGTGSAITAIAPYIPNSTDEQILATTLKATTNSLFLFDPQIGTQSFVQFGGSTDSAPFDQAVQFGGIAYLNSGRQYSSANPSNTYLWHYPAPTQAVYGYTVTATTAGGLAAGTYYYAFTQVVTAPNMGFSQETTELGADVIAGQTPPNNLAYNATVTGTAGAVNISGTFAGTMPDGASYTTNVYRQSSLQPVWYLLTNLTTNATYQDTNSDLSISSNAQLTFHRDPPPIASNNLPAITIHKERTWVFTIVQNAATNNLPQPQLLYSNLGRPWEFDIVNNVLLIGSSATPTNPGSYQGTYGDEPVALCSLSSVLVCLKTRSMWVVYGDDQTSFIQRQIFGTLGTRARQSVALGLVSQTLAMFWLSEYGVMMFDGSSPLRIDDDISNVTRSLKLADRIAAVGFYANLTYYISFPTLGTTWGFYTTTGKWFQVPYTTSFAYGIPSNPAYYGATAGVNEVTAVRTGTNYIDAWFGGGESDLGSPQTVTWTGPLSDSDQPATEKIFTHVIVVAPIQPGITATVTLTVDGVATVLPPFDLGTTTRNICEVPAFAQQDRGFLNSISIMFTTVPGATFPVIIYKVAAYGDYGRTLVLQQ